MRVSDAGITISIAAVVVMVIAIIVFYPADPARAGFTSRRAAEVVEQSRGAFEEGDTSYSRYKNRVDGADPILYTDVRRLWAEGRLSPEEVEKIL
jgi:hypothetical protein